MRYQVQQNRFSGKWWFEVFSESGELLHGSYPVYQYSADAGLAAEAFIQRVQRTLQGTTQCRHGNRL